jgi:inner membrane protein
MTGRTHDLAAISALAITAVTYGVSHVTLATALVAVFANLAGGIAPDIDQPTAPFWRNLPVGGVLGRMFDKMLGGHRFLTHSLIGVGLFGVAAYALLKFLGPIIPSVDPVIVWWAFMIGVLSHLVMDSFTEEGVPWLLPIPVKFGFPPFKSLRISTGKLVETLVVFPALLVFDAVYCYQNYSTFLSLIHRIGP